MATPSCHPNEKHYSLGLCRSCYEKGLRARNPQFSERQRDNCRQWVKLNRARKLQTDRAYSRKRRTTPQAREYYRSKKLEKYGITLVDYEMMLAIQSGRCAICRRPPDKTRLAVDHDHATGRVRGLLCFRCNYGLSWFSSNAAKLRAAAEYLSLGDGALPIHMDR